MIVEWLYAEHTGMLGDSGNIAYLKACLPDAEFVHTALSDVPYFVDHKVDLLYMGSMAPSVQPRIIMALMPFVDRLQACIDSGVPVLFTGNAAECLGREIVLENGNSMAGLGVLPTIAKWQHGPRYNGLTLGRFAPVSSDIVGFQCRATATFGDYGDTAFLKLERGQGANRQTHYEGYTKQHFVATHLVGPLLVLNPAFTRWLLDAMGAADAPLAFEEAVNDAYMRRLAEFCDPGVATQ